MSQPTLFSPEEDPYVLTGAKIQEPPARWWGRIRHLGPGFVLSAGIVGSGELIATTTLGAEAGFTTFWVILVSCLVKVAIQLEYGKHAISSGESVMAAFNKLPGPRMGKAHWSVWAWVGIMTLKILQVGGIVGGVAITLNIAFPSVSITVWALGVAILVSLLVFRGHYKFIEGVSLVLIGLFTLFTFMCLGVIQYTDYAITWDQLATGLSFQLPPEAVGVAIAAFGLTGVGGDEITYYNYWCLEKGYAAFAGPPDHTPQWIHRAKGWIKVMYMDAILSMVVYTLVTAAFYLLGAAILNSRGEIPQGYEMIEILSRMYTETLGPWAKSAFLIGSVVVLFSTVFTALAAWTRIFTDAFGQIGWIDFFNIPQRTQMLTLLSWIFPLCWACIFLFLRLPVLMVLIGGVLTSGLLLVIVYVAIHFRYKRLHKSLIPPIGYDIAFWISAVSIGILGVYSVYKLL